MNLLLLAAAASAADTDRFERLTRRGERLTHRTVRAEQRWTTASAAIADADTDADAIPERAQRQVVRTERSLVGARFRESCVQRRLAAWDAPERDVPVFYATNRRRATGGFVARDADRMEYGVVKVRVPARHPAGVLDRDLQVIEAQSLTEEAFLVALGGELDRAGPSSEILAYVHGYNNSFDYSVRRTAQIAHDLGMPTVPVLFAWPSHGGEWLSSAKYTYDENAAARSSSMFADLLDQLMSGTAGAPVNVLAHSLGSRVVADALVDLDRRDAIRDRLDQLVLAAPDIDAAVYGRRYLDLSLEAADRLTVYCAGDDRALKLSRGVHGGYDRLGSCRPDTISALERPGLDIVDASRLYVDLIDHDKVADSPRLLDDLAAVLQGIPAADPGRGLVDRRDHFELPP